MDHDRSHVDADNAPRRHGALRLVVMIVGLSLAASGIVAWQVVAANPARARLGGSPGGSASPESGGSAHASGTEPPRSTTTTAAPTTTTTTAPTATTTIPTDPGVLRVIDIGDSLGVDLGVALQSTWSPARVQVTMAARTDTGLTNSAYYDWPVALAGLLASVHPQVVVVLLGANDLQPMRTGSATLVDGTPAWNAAYAARVTAIVSESVRAGAHVVWVGEPVMQTAFINAGMTRLDGIAQAVIARYGRDALYADSNAVLAPAGTFTFDTSRSTGQQVAVRTPDGVHLTPTGAGLLASAVASAMADAWGMQVVGD